MNDEIIRVLSIEDNPAEAMLIQEKLDEAQHIGWNLPHFEVEHVSRLKTALARLDREAFDVVLTDLDLPDSRAGQTVATLRDKTPHMPLVVLTGRDDEILAQKSVMAGVQDYLYKSEATGSLLARTMMYAIQRQQIHAQLEQRVEERTQELKQANQELKTEIAERRRVERALRENEAKYRGLVEQSLQGLVIAQDDPVRITFASQPMETITGFSPEELMALGPQELVNLIHPQDRLTFFQNFRDRLQGKDVPPRNEYRVIHKDGEVGWVELYSSRIEYEGAPATQTLFLDITSRKRAEKARQESERRYRELFEKSRDGFVVVDPQGRFLDANPAYCRMLGYTLDELQQKRDFYDVTPPSWRDWEREEIWEKRLLQEGYSGVYSKEYVHKDGTVFPVELQSYAFFDEEGQPQYLWGIVRDISPQKRTQEALRESEERYRSLFESIRDAILVANTDREIIDCNPSFTDLFGYTLDEIKGKRTQYVYENEEEFKQLGDALQEHLGETNFFFTVNYRKKSGQVFPGETNVFYLRDSRQDVVGFIGLIRDITERKRAEEALRWRSEANQAIAHLSAALLEQTPVAQIAYQVLEHARRLTGSAFGYVGYIDSHTGHLVCPTMTRDIWDDCQVPDKDVVFEQFGGLWGWVLENRKPLLTNALQDDPRSSGIPEGHLPILRFLSVPALVGGELVGQIALANPPDDYRERDLELVERMASIYALALQRQRSEERIERYAANLERSNRDLEQLGYAISHDLREPLRVISSYLQLLAQRYGGQLDVRADKYIDYAVDGAERLQEMIQALLDLSRVESRGQPFEPTEVEKILKQTVRDLKKVIRESSAHVTHDPLPTVTADRIQLGQVFQNLIANGIKFCREDQAPRVHVSAEQTDGEWIFSVTDNGIGIAPQHAERVFQVFQRLHTGDEYPGLGIGLAVCRRIVERHGGRIWVASEPGQGATFYFTLPA